MELDQSSADIFDQTEPDIGRRKSSRNIRSSQKIEMLSDGLCPVTLEDLMETVQCFRMKFKTHTCRGNRTVDEDEALSIGIRLRSFARLLQNEKKSTVRHYPDEPARSINAALSKIYEVLRVIESYTNKGDGVEQKTLNSSDDALSDNDISESRFDLPARSTRTGNEKLPKQIRKVSTFNRRRPSKKSEAVDREASQSHLRLSRLNDSPAVPRPTKRFKKSTIAIAENSNSLELKPKKSAGSNRKSKSSKIHLVEPSDGKSATLSDTKIMSAEETGTEIKIHSTNVQVIEQSFNAQRAVRRTSTSPHQPDMLTLPGRVEVDFPKTQSEDLVDSSDIIPPTTVNSQSWERQPRQLETAEGSLNPKDMIAQNGSACLQPFLYPPQTGRDFYQTRDQVPENVNHNADEDSTAYHSSPAAGNGSRIKPWNKGIEAINHCQEEFCGEESVLHTLNEAFTFGTSVSNDLASSNKNELDPSKKHSPHNQTSSFQPYEATCQAAVKPTPTFDTELASHSQSYPSIGVPQSLEDRIAVSKQKMSATLLEQSSSKRCPPGEAKQPTKAKKTRSRSRQQVSHQEKAGPSKTRAGSSKTSQADTLTGIAMKKPIKQNSFGQNASVCGSEHETEIRGKSCQEPLVLGSDNLWESQPCCSHQQINQLPAASTDTELNEERHTSVGFEADSLSPPAIEGTPIQKLQSIATPAGPDDQPMRISDHQLLLPLTSPYGYQPTRSGRLTGRQEQLRIITATKGQQPIRDQSAHIFLLSQSNETEANINAQALFVGPAVQSESQIVEPLANEKYGSEKQRTSNKKSGSRNPSSQLRSPKTVPKNSKSNPSRQTIKPRNKKAKDSSSQTYHQAPRTWEGEWPLDEEPGATRWSTQPDRLFGRFDNEYLPMQSQEGLNDQIQNQKPQTIRHFTSSHKFQMCDQLDRSAPAPFQRMFSTAPAQTTFIQAEQQHLTTQQPGSICGTPKMQSHENRCQDVNAEPSAPCQTKFTNELSGSHCPAERTVHQLPTNAGLFLHPAGNPQQDAGDSEYLLNTWMSHNRPSVRNSSQGALLTARPGPSSSRTSASKVIHEDCHDPDQSQGGRQSLAGKGTSNSRGEDESPAIQNPLGQQLSICEICYNWREQLEEAKKNPYIHAWDEYVFPASEDKVPAVLEWMWKVMTKEKTIP
ncbi:Hypothetical protein NTJ_16150 [Nesidiocoris tenuis]|uniref:Uncharacterized protein n=2 Tax=Nesidiocoris tenuis TaxID=355587 RepID=A0ABN7BG74_9HEMI|nr:Hypothetical protein NTJ_16150 [Nesidiocoris tenuis]